MAGKSCAEASIDTQVYTYNWFAGNSLRRVPPATTYLNQDYYGYYGRWRIGSVGPDLNWYNVPGATSGIVRASRVYDPTNGLVSYGNIWRSEKVPEPSWSGLMTHVW